MKFKTKFSRLAISVSLCLVMLLLCMPITVVNADDRYTVNSSNKLIVTGKITEFPPCSFYNIEVAHGGEIAFPDDFVCKYDVNNLGTISGGTFTGNVSNEGTINGGIFQKDIEESGTINGGTFHGNVKSEYYINGGTFLGEVKNMYVINGGTFHGKVVNEHIIKNGSFRVYVVNNNTLKNGQFNCTVENNHVIEDGVFGFAVFNNGLIHNGKFTVLVKGAAPITAIHNVNGTDKPLTCGNNLLDELGDAGDGYAWFAGEDMVTDDSTVPILYAEYTAKEYSHSTVQGGNGGNNADALIASEIQRIEQELSKFDIAAVNTDNLQALEQLDEDIDFLLNYNGLSDDHKKSLEATKQQVTNLITAINTPDDSSQENTQESTQESDSTEISYSPEPDNSQATDSQATGTPLDGSQPKYNIAILIAVIVCAVAALGIFIYRKIKA